MRNYWYLSLVLLTGCIPMQTQPEETTAQVPASPFANPKPLPVQRVSYAPASPDVVHRVLLVKDQLLAKNPQVGMKPYAIAVSSSDPEVFHTGNTIYVTEALVRQCPNDNQLAAVLAHELGRMVAHRESTVSADVRQPERPLPINLPIGGGANASDVDPLRHIELVRHEKAHPRPARKLAAPNPQHVARTLLENAGYQRTDLDAVLPILARAERFHVLENQFKAPTKQSEWKAP